MLPAGFEPATQAGDRLQTHALDRSAAGIGWLSTCKGKTQESLLIDCWLIINQGTESTWDPSWGPCAEHVSRLRLTVSE